MGGSCVWIFLALWRVERGSRGDVDVMSRIVRTTSEYYFKKVPMTMMMIGMIGMGNVGVIFSLRKWTFGFLLCEMRTINIIVPEFSHGLGLLVVSRCRKLGSAIFSVSMRFTRWSWRGVWSLKKI